VVIDAKGGEVIHKDSVVWGASSKTCMLHLNVHYICLLAWHKFYNSLSMLVRCMLDYRK
jgi:hypothetical protein